MWSEVDSPAGASYSSPGWMWREVDCPAGASSSSPGWIWPEVDCPAGASSSSPGWIWPEVDCPAGASSSSPGWIWPEVGCPAGAGSSSPGWIWPEVDCPAGASSSSPGWIWPEVDCPAVASSSPGWIWPEVYCPAGAGSSPGWIWTNIDRGWKSLHFSVAWWRVRSWSLVNTTPQNSHTNEPFCFPETKFRWNQCKRFFSIHKFKESSLGLQVLESFWLVFFQFLETRFYVLKKLGDNNTVGYTQKLRLGRIVYYQKIIFTRWGRFQAFGLDSLPFRSFNSLRASLLRQMLLQTCGGCTN